MRKGIIFFFLLFSFLICFRIKGIWVLGIAPEFQGLLATMIGKHHKEIADRQVTSSHVCLTYS